MGKNVCYKGNGGRTRNYKSLNVIIKNRTSVSSSRQTSKISETLITTKSDNSKFKKKIVYNKKSLSQKQ